MITNLIKEAEQNGSKWYKEYKPTKSIIRKIIMNYLLVDGLNMSHESPSMLVVKVLSI